MSNTEEVMAACDWCLQEAPVRTIDDHLWRFWKIISTEDPTMKSHRNICDKCKTRYEGFSIYIERCKINASKVDELLLSMGQVKDEPTVDIEYPPFIKKEISYEVGWNSYRPAVSSGEFIHRQTLAECSNSPINDSKIDVVLPTGKVKKEPLIDLEDDLINEDIWKEDASDPEYPTALGSKGEDSIVLQKKVNTNHMCTYCGKTFDTPRKLKIHWRTHTSQKPFRCSHCNKRFVCSSHLNIHLRTHTGEKPYKCSHCDNSFAQLCHLSRHLHTHTGEKSYKCPHCNKSFAQSNNLNSHLRTHTGEKPYQCSHCDKSFARSNHLNRHLRTHTGEKPFRCSHCDKSFAQSCHLNVHLRTHTGEKPYECSICNKCFTRTGDLSSHLRVHTNNK